MSIQTLSNSAVIPEQSKKIHYIDNLKIGFITLVVLRHTLITYGAEGGRYYAQKTTPNGALIPMTLLVFINQAFIMGVFFFLSVYFIQGSLKRKGAARFNQASMANILISRDGKCWAGLDFHLLINSIEQQ